MKKIIKILLVVNILLFFYTTKNINILPFTVSISMYMLFKSLFSTTSIKKVIEAKDELCSFFEVSHENASNESVLFTIS